MSRIGLKLSCFVVSVIIWVQVASTSTVEQTTSLPLRLTGVGEGLTATGSEIPRTVKVRVQGSKLSLLTHNYFNRYIGEVRVTVSDRPAGPTFSYELDQNDVFSDLVVIGIQPPVRLRLKLDREVQRMLPVHVRTSGALANNVGFLAPTTVAPDSVMVTGPERFFPPSGLVNTEAVDLTRRDDSGLETVSLMLPHEHLKMASKDVQVTFQVAAMEERTLANIPVIPLVDVGQPEVGVSPPVVDVMVRGVADSVRALRGDRIMVTVPVGNLPRGVHVVAGQADLPPWLTLIGLDPAEFRVVVGDFEPIKADSLRNGTENPFE
jgi:YbbR domain-containing protein